MADREPGRVQSVCKAMDLLSCLAEARTPLTLGELVAAVVERKKLLTHSEMKAARYARSVQCFVEYLRDTGRLDVVVDRGMRRFVRR